MKYTYLLLAMLIFLPGCSGLLTKPSTPPTGCIQPATEPVSKAPAGGVKEWAERGPLWAVEALSTLALERHYRYLEQQCYQGAKR